MSNLLTWRRAVVDRSARYAGRRKVWPSACGRYRVIWRDAAYGVALCAEYHAMVCRQIGDDREMWELLSRHRQRRPAEAACERHARQCQQADAAAQPRSR